MDEVVGGEGVVGGVVVGVEGVEGEEVEAALEGMTLWREGEEWGGEGELVREGGVEVGWVGLGVGRVDVDGHGGVEGVGDG
ncbi:hypothetical protein [Kocuria salsicia]|uniref:hypothetical protein n=1 Tax=Kocuria salsicia TaxID=664639 RepID=UPI0016438B85|nr:hypothetical protein [Kocuria salsicia]